MNPERWLRIDELFSAALERPDAERGAFLAVACGGDEALRVEVERLLSAYQAASGFLETPPAGAVPPFPAGTWTDANLPTRDAGSASTAGANLPSLSLSSSAPPGTVLGRYIILNRLGRGGMGVVYVAYDPELDRKVALKLLRAEGAGAGRDGRARLLREAQAMARLSHPNVIAVHDVGTFGEQVFIAMEFIDGHTLKRWLKEKQRSVREIVDALVQAGRGLAAAHAAGLVHRDFKPDNVLVAKDGRVKVLDFGLARPVEDLLGSAPTVPPAFGTGSGKPVLSDPLTRTGALFGTPGYMAPEQFLGKPTDARTDQFSFCITLHEALYGERPFGGDSLEALKEQLAAGKVREPERPVRVPAVVRQVLRRGLRADPSERYPSMDAVLQDLGKDPRAKRRRAFTVGALALGLAAITVGYRQQWRRQLQICKGAGQKLAGVWDEERRGVLAAAFTASGKPYAADALRAVQQALDGYARGWVDMHTEACEATRLRGEQSEELLDLRMACLSDRRHELKSLVDIFSRGEARVIERAPQAALGLTPLSDCANAVALKAPVPLPADVPVRASVEALRQKLAEGRALEVAGKFTDGLPIAKEVVARSQPLRYRPLEAEALLRLARFQFLTGDFNGSEKTCRQTVVAALAGRHDNVLAHAWIYLLYAAEELGAFQRGHEAADMAAAVLERLENADEMRAGLFQGLGTLVIKEGKHADALEYSRRAQEIWERIFGPEHPNVADTLSNAAIALRQLGRYQEAVDNYRRTAAIKEKVYGTNHPWVVASDSNLGIVYRSQGRYELAVEHHRRALELSEKLLGPQHPWVSRTLSNFGASLTGLGRYDEALTYLQRGLQLGEKTYGPKHLEVGRILGNIGRALLGEEQYQPALEHLQRSLGIVEKVSGPDHPELVLLLVDLALGRFERHKPGDSDAAEEYLRRALAIREKASGPESPEIADVLSAMAQILREKDPRKALEHLERARQIREKSLPADSLLIPATLADIADVHLRLRQPLEAKRVLERALLLQSNGNPPTNVARTKFLMARALWDANSDKERAVTLSEAARAELLEAGRRKTRIYRQLEAWLASRTAAGRNM